MDGSAAGWEKKLREQLTKVNATVYPVNLPEPRAALTLIKPITWFPPMWAYLCGTISAGGSSLESWGLVLLGVLLAGPIVCGMSQAANDWCDRHVDAINEPHRPIPSGRIPGRWGLWIALAMSALSLVGWLLGPWGFAATVVGRARGLGLFGRARAPEAVGLVGPGLVGLSYETLPWFTGAACCPPAPRAGRSSRSPRSTASARMAS
jgi:chlorophyll/bacteriochlorophyll a synthase